MLSAGVQCMSSAAGACRKKQPSGISSTRRHWIDGAASGFERLASGTILTKRRSFAIFVKCPPKLLIRQFVRARGNHRKSAVVLQLLQVAVLAKQMWKKSLNFASAAKKNYEGIKNLSSIRDRQSVATSRKIQNSFLPSDR